MKKIGSILYWLLSIIILSGCAKPISISISPANPTLAIGMTLQMSALGYNADGSLQDVTTTATWDTSDSAIATIDSLGIVTATSAGTAVISATIDSTTASMPITINNSGAQVSLAYLSITPSNPSLSSGSMVQLQAIGTYSDNSVQDLTSLVTWDSGDATVATVNTTGMLTGINQGTTSISATSGSVTATTVVSVTIPTVVNFAIRQTNSIINVGASDQLVATATYSNGLTLNVNSLATWSASLANITAGGLVTPLNIGAIVMATFAGLSTPFSLNIAPTPTWVSGSNTTNATGVYGTLGVAATGNVPGARFGSTTWIDSSGNLWLFGGMNNTNQAYNDLWKYNPITNQWTWINGNNVPNSFGVYGTLGVAAPGNMPGARTECASWTDNAGNFWLFGGQTSTVTKNDLWKYNPTTNEWTWISGSNTINVGGGTTGVYGTKGTPAPGNIPGSRFGSVSWMDSTGNFWLFGGQGYDANSNGRLGDLWKYNPVSNQWTWISGSNTINTAGVYGTQGVPDVANTPGNRREGISWTDSKGNFWLFGGIDIDSFNDLWKYNPTTNQWTWISGSNTSGSLGVYGTLGIGSSANVPGARHQSVSWVDMAGNLWLFGGYSTPTLTYRNDLWKYDIVKNQWIWIAGSSAPYVAGTYGTLGVASSANMPGARYGSAAWSDMSGNLWLFGGYGGGYLNDLWKF